MASGWAWLGWLALIVILAIGGWAGWVFYNAKRQGLPPPPLKAYIPFANRGQPSANYPTPRSSNPIEWIKDQIAKIRNRRTHQGAYEENNAAEQGYSNVGLRGTAAGGGGGHSAGSGGTGADRGRGRGRGLEDDAWDTQVGNEDPYGASGPGGYYEEQELGLAATPGYGNESYGRQTDYINSQDTTYHSSGGGGGSSSTTHDRGRTLTTPRPIGAQETQNPFDDEHAAPSLRSVSPRPADVDTTSRSKHRRENSSLDSTRSSTTSVRKSHFQEGDMR